MGFYTFLGGRMLKSLRRFGIVLLGVTCLCLTVLGHSQPIAAQAGVNLATISEILDGNQVFIQNRQASVNDRASRGQRVLTREARAALLFNNGAVGRLGKNSILTVGDRCAQLRRGQILVSGAANSCSSSVVAGVRGTTYLLEVDDNDQTFVKVLEGEVSVASERVVIPEDGEFGTIVPNSPSHTVQPIQPIPGNPSRGKSGNKQLPWSIPVPTSSTPAPSQSQSSSSPSQPDNTSTGGGTVTVVKSGEKVAYNPSQGTFGAVEKMTQQEFEAILTGALFDGFTIQIPGLQEVQQSFQSLFPGVPFPISVPGLSIPAPIRLPFGF